MRLETGLSGIFRNKYSIVRQLLYSQIFHEHHVFSTFLSCLCILLYEIYKQIQNLHQYHTVCELYAQMMCMCSTCSCLQHASMYVPLLNQFSPKAFFCLFCYNVHDCILRVPFKTSTSIWPSDILETASEIKYFVMYCFSEIQFYEWILITQW